VGGEYPKTIVSFLMVSFLLGPSLCSSSLLVCNNPEEALWSAYPSGAFHLLEKLQISKMCASLIIGKSALEIFRSKIKLRCHFKQPIKRNGFLSSGHPNMITKINHHKRNLFLSFFSTNAFFEKHTWSSKILHPVFEARPDSDPETAAWMVPYLRSASGLLGPRVKGPFEKWRKNGALFWRNCVKFRLVEFLDFPETSRVLHEAVGRFLKTIQDQLQLVQAFLSKTEDVSQD